MWIKVRYRDLECDDRWIVPLARTVTGTAIAWATVTVRDAIAAAFGGRPLSFLDFLWVVACGAGMGNLLPLILFRQKVGVWESRTRIQ